MLGLAMLAILNYKIGVRKPLVNSAKKLSNKTLHR